MPKHSNYYANMMVMGFASDFDPAERREVLINKFSENFPAPRLIQIQSGNKCNLHCKMCPTYGDYYLGNETGLRKDEPDFEYLRVEQLERIFSQMDGVDFQAINLKIQLYDEPLLNPEYCELIRLAKKMGVNFTYFDTNGTLLTPELIKALLTSRLDSISISIDAATSETYRNLRRVDNLAHVTEMVKLLNQLRRRLNPTLKLAVSFVEVPDNIEEKNDFIKNWIDHVDVVRFNRAFYSDGHINNLYEPITRERDCCHIPWTSITIMTNGDIVKCMFDYNHKDNIIGNIFQDNLLKIWNSAPYMRYREAHISGSYDTIDSCRQCDTWTRKIPGKEYRSGQMIIGKGVQQETYAKRKILSKGELKYWLRPIVKPMKVLLSKKQK